MSKSNISIPIKSKAPVSQAVSSTKLAKPVAAFGTDSDSELDSHNGHSILTNRKTGTRKPTTSQAPPQPAPVAITRISFDEPADSPAAEAADSDSSDTRRRRRRLRVKNQPLKSPPRRRVANAISTTDGAADAPPHPTCTVAVPMLPGRVTDVDPSIYDYDGVYDALKDVSSSKTSGASSRPDGGARYLDALLASSTTRKRDRQIAEDKKLARERVAEGEKFADKEAFVTSSYAKLREENARAEEEERAREEQLKASARSQGGGMSSSFYRDILNEREKVHEKVVQKTEELAARKARIISGQAGPDDEKQLQEEGSDYDEQKDKKVLDAKEVTVNDDGEVVDKRELLSGGLNVGSAARKKAQQARERQLEDRRIKQEARTRSDLGSKDARRERQSRMIEEQLAAQLKRTRDLGDEEKLQLERNSKSRKTEGEIQSARERYLARRKAAEEAKKTGKITS